MLCVRILVVEDFEAWRRFISSMVEKEPQLRIICEVSDGLEAVQKAKELKPDLILLDLGLPKLNGIDAARQIRRFTPKSKILFLSQESSAAVVQEALGIGTGYVVKADAGRELLPAVKAVMLGEQFLSSRLTVHTFEEGVDRLVPEELQ
jgi:DNA-binding NarL/FixJ family response regulator